MKGYSAISKGSGDRNAISSAGKPSSFFKPVIQPKLTINQPNDMYEQEADAMADKVMRLADNETVQTKFFKPAISPLQRMCAGCEEDEKKMQRKEMNGEEATADDSLESYIGSLSSGGQPLPDETRNFYEPRLGYDFSNVKVHTDTVAAKSAQSINALAYTSGSNIVFNNGQYSPNSDSGKRLLGHELTHVVQQNGSAHSIPQNAQAKIVQADFAVEPTTPARTVPTLTATQIQDAITFNQARHTDPVEIGLLRDILGISKVPQVIDDDFINAVVRYQAQFGLTRDGNLGHDTADRLAREIIEESDFMGPGNLGSLAPEFALQTAIQALIAANNRLYVDYKAAILGATMIQQHVALRNQQLLRDIHGQLSWNNWARCVELMGRIPPTGNDMMTDPTVIAALGAAWTASNAGLTRLTAPLPAGHALAATCDPIPGAPPSAAHEEGGWIYLNLITGNLTTRRAVAGGQAAIDITNGAPNVADSVIVGTFHTHPNVGPCWGAVFASGPDVANSTTRGLPNLIQGAFPALGNIQRVIAGPLRRNHLAGNRLIPGAGGGLAPQADILGREYLE